MASSHFEFDMLMTLGVKPEHENLGDCVSGKLIRHIVIELELELPRSRRSQELSSLSMKISNACLLTG